MFSSIIMQGIISLCIFIVFFFSGCSSQINKNSIYPGITWQRCTPESQGMDSDRLLSALKIIDLKRSGIDSMVIIRNGYIVSEFYKQPFDKTTHFRINSATKSFTSTLIGIAIDENLISGVDELVMKYFPAYSNVDQRVENLSIEDLLTMRSGFEWNSSLLLNDPENDDMVFQIKDDWLGYLFTKPMVVNPGEEFNYNSMNSVLLAEILQRATNGDSFNFANERLFKPIGITSWAWGISPVGGGFIGGNTLVMSTEDLARLGYLYLNNGVWNREQIVSRQWIADSVELHAQISQNGRKLDEYYGYQWWVKDRDCFFAKGGLGQYCFVDRKNKIVVAINSSFDDFSSQNKRLESFLINDIQRSIISNKGIVSNRMAVNNLRDYLNSATELDPVGPFIAVSTLIDKLNNKKIEFEENSLGLKSITLGFDSHHHMKFENESRLSNGQIVTARRILRYDGMYKKEVLKGTFNTSYHIVNLIPERYSRVTSIREKFLSFESFFPGVSKVWITHTLDIDGDNILYRIYIRRYGGREAKCITLKGQFL